MPRDQAPTPLGLGARRAALEVVERCLNGAYLAPTLSDILNESSLQGPDRSLVTELSYGVVRRLPQLDSALAPYLKAPKKLPPRVVTALRLGAYELRHRGTPPYAAVSAWVEVVKSETRALAGLANAVLRKVAAADLDLADDTALPAWLLQSFKQALGEGAARQAALGMLEPEPLWLTAFSSGATARLEAQGSEVRPGPLPYSLAVRSPVPVAELGAFREGLVQPQNPSSLFTALAVGAAEGDEVLDLASGQGVKAAIMAATGATVVAVELVAERSRAAERNLSRIGVSVKHVVADLVRTPPADLLEAVGGPALKILLDAPCSGTGTLRGNPEIKLRLEPDDVLALEKNQAAMLDTASGLLAPGGRLVYSVCSLTEEEGPRQVEAFLQRHEGFAVEHLDCPLPHQDTAYGTFILPVDGLDGFFVGVLVRVEHGQSG